MKRLLIFSLIIILASLIISAKEEHGAIPVRFAYGRTVDIGFSSGVLSDNKLPETNLSEIKFSYNTTTGMLESTPTFVAYFISYVPYRVQASISVSGELVAGVYDSSANPPDSIPWTSNLDGFSSSTTTAIPILTDHEYPTGATALDYIRTVQTNPIALYVDPEDIPMEGDNFTATITLAIAPM